MLLAYQKTRTKKKKKKSIYVTRNFKTKQNLTRTDRKMNFGMKRS